MSFMVRLVDLLYREQKLMEHSERIKIHESELQRT